MVRVTTFNLRTLKLRSGEQFRDEQEIELEPLELRVGFLEGAYR